MAIKRADLEKLLEGVEKKDEIINIFKEGMPSEKTQVINIMKQIDPTNSSSYDAINSSSNSSFKP